MAERRVYLDEQGRRYVLENDGAPPATPKKKRPSVVALILFGLFIAFALVVAIAMFAGSSRTPLPADVQATNQRVLEDLKALQDSGLVQRFDAQMNEAYVNPRIWHPLTIQAKENITRTLALACEAQGDKAWVEVKDNYSGEKLASYGFAGFKGYP